MPTLGVFAAILDDSNRILCVRMNYATHAFMGPGVRTRIIDALDGASGIVRIIPETHAL